MRHKEKYDEVYGTTAHHRYICFEKDNDFISYDEMKKLIDESNLDSRSKSILIAWIFRDVSLSDVGKRYGFCRERARQIVNSSLRKIGIRKVYQRVL